ncbi:MAG: MmgE/PrpD family protein [Deltaproteobacteria bacterium]|nr:MmgE/PrpD family protein [Deltaproteobacteria bacterium]
MRYTKKIAENIVNTRYEDLPHEVIEKTKRHILDILGVMLPSSRFEKSCKALEEIAKEGGGKEESTLIGFGGKVPCWMAAFVNGSLCHPMDFDDTVDEFPNHPSSNIFPAALAVSERNGNVSGREFITAVALAMDLSVRLAAAPKGKVGQDFPWFSVTVFGGFSAAAVTGKILGLNLDQMVNAFGISLDRSFGITESMNAPESEFRAIRDGFGNREGLLAALMAEKGIAASRSAFEILYKVYYDDEYDPLLLTSNLGKDFWGLKVGLKAWPCCRVSHTYIKAAMDMITEHEIKPEKIREIILTVGKFGRDFLCEPREIKLRPKVSIQAKLSLPFIMGLVFVKKRVLIEDFFPESLENRDVLEVAEKTRYVFDEELAPDSIGTGIVEIRMRDGSSFIKKEDIPYGNPKNPMSDEELRTKFNDCAQYSLKPMDNKAIDNIRKKILDMENIENITEISEMLS